MTCPAHTKLERILREREEELDEARERIQELEHELEVEHRDNPGYTIQDGVYVDD